MSPTAHALDPDPGRVHVIDTDAHWTEPNDLWLSNLPSKWRDRAPRTETDPVTGRVRWRVGDRWLFSLGNYSHAGWKEFPPSRPLSREDMHPGCYDMAARLSWMDEHGIAAQILYPNVVGFEGHAIMALNDRELQRAIVGVYNDYMRDLSGQSGGRLVPICAIPFWDVNEAIQELKRCAAMGYSGALWPATLQKHGLPATTDPEWDPFYAVAQDLDISINFHIGVGLTLDEVEFFTSRSHEFDVTLTVGGSSLAFMSNGTTVTDLIMSGLCERFPRLKFVSVESGFGYFPYLLETLDWQWKNYNGSERTKRLLPSEYFERQIFSTFWFEESCLSLMSRYADNVMFETDFPHTTCLASGAGTAAPDPEFVIQRAKSVLDPVTFRKVMQTNAAGLYRVATQSISSS